MRDCICVYSTALSSADTTYWHHSKDYMHTYSLEQTWVDLGLAQTGLNLETLRAFSAVGVN